MINQNNRITISLRSTFTLVCMLLTFTHINFTQAQESEGFSAVIGANIGQDDNIFRSSDELDDQFFLLTPALKLTELYESVQLDAQYKGNYRQYADNNHLNYYDHDVSVKGQYKHTSKFISELSIGYASEIEEPGTTNAIGSVLDKFTKISSTSLKAAGTYGAKNSRGQIRVAYDFAKRQFDNNQSFRDFDSNKLTGMFFYRLAPKSRLLFETSLNEVNYKNTDLFDASSNQNRYLLGAEWAATTKISSIFKVGYQEVNYDHEFYTDISSLAFDLELIWKPNTYSIIKLGADRSAQESAVQGLPSFISETYSLGFQHEFTFKSRISVNYNYRKDDYSDSQNRSDNLSAIEARYTYALKRSLHLSLDYSHKKRNSDFAIYDYDANIYMLGIDWLVD